MCNLKFVTLVNVLYVNLEFLYDYDYLKTLDSK